MPSAPRSLILSRSEDEPPVVQAVWQAPRYSYGDILGYRLIYGIRGDSHTEERRFDGPIYRHTTGFLGQCIDPH